MRRLMLLVFLLAVPLTARADFLWDLRVGAKGGVTGNLWGAPDGAPRTPGASAGWQKDLMYVGGGAGLLLEAHALQFLALEIDVLYQTNAFLENINGDQAHIYTRYNQVRLPLLVKGVLPLGATELSLGVGPEFTFGTKAWLDTDGMVNPSGFDAVSVNDTFVDLDLGVTFRVWKLAIPLSLRTGFNLSQPKQWTKRFDTFSATRLVVKASETYQFSLLLGVAYVF